MAKAPITPLDAEIEAEVTKQEENRKDLESEQNADNADKANRQKDGPHAPGEEQKAERQPS